MGQKVNPHGLRVGVIKDWDAKWYAEDDFADNLVEDYNIRKFLKNKLYAAGISKIETERASDRLKIVIHTAKPGIVIGKGGAEIEKVKADVDITKADILVGAGRGAENCLDVLQKVADELGGVVCCTRAVVEDGFLDKDRQVGQTGKTVRPSLYIACGISGAVQHCAGMDKSDLIISINRDPQAEIFNISNMGFVGDCATVLPLLVESIKAAKAE